MSDDMDKAAQRCRKEWENVNDPPCHPSNPNWKPCEVCAPAPDDLVKRIETELPLKHFPLAKAIIDRIEQLERELAQARRTAEYWKAEHNAANKRIEQLDGEANRWYERFSTTAKRTENAEAELAAVLAKCGEWAERYGTLQAALKAANERIEHLSEEIRALRGHDQ